MQLGADDMQRPVPALADQSCSWYNTHLETPKESHGLVLPDVSRAGEHVGRLNRQHAGRSYGCMCQHRAGFSTTGIRSKICSRKCCLKNGRCRQQQPTRDLHVGHVKMRMFWAGALCKQACMRRGGIPCAWVCVDLRERLAVGKLTEHVALCNVSYLVIAQKAERRCSDV